MLWSLSFPVTFTPSLLVPTPTNEGDELVRFKYFMKIAKERKGEHESYLDFSIYGGEMAGRRESRAKFIERSESVDKTREPARRSRIHPFAVIQPIASSKAAP